MTEHMDLTAVIPFRNRGPERLRLAVGSILEGTSSKTEVIISDFGSDDPGVARGVAEEFGARVVYTAADHWSRSSALNAGFREARGAVFLGADADIIWGPQAIDEALRQIRTETGICVAFECQFMGPDISVDDVLQTPHDWERFNSSAKLNPRWGVGMLFFPRQAFEATNGYESRMRTYGYEDNDFSERVRAIGYRIKWEGAGRYRAYHVWHERPGLQAKHDKVLAAEYAANRELFTKQKSVVRNVVGGGVASDAPLVSVAIATQNRSEMLRTALASVLCQTVQSFEVIVVDDGSSDDTADVVAAFDDERIRYIRQEPAGISVARNRALDEARGRFTAVMDDDDIMPPWRLERSFERIHGSEHGCVGSFVTFDDMSGDLVAWADPFPTMLGAYPNGGFAGHPTWMVRTDVLRAFRYDESFTSAVDNNIALRMLRAGVRLRHAGAVLNLRRVHGGQVTSLDSAFQGRGARLDATWLRSGSTAAEIREQADEAKSSQMSGIPSSVQQAEVVAFLPDHLVDRTIWVRSELEASAAEILQRLPRASSIEVAQADGTSVVLLCVEGATWADCAFVATRPETTILEWHGRHRNTPRPISANRTRLLSDAIVGGPSGQVTLRLGGGTWFGEVKSGKIQFRAIEEGIAR